jgi:flagellar hook-basal body complex protein FliE
MQIQSHSSLLNEFAARLGQSNRPSGTETPTKPDNFGDLLIDGLREVNNKQTESQSQVEGLLSGEDVDTAEVITSIQKADMAFQLLVQVRNKLMQAYEQIQAINI